MQGNNFSHLHKKINNRTANDILAEYRTQPEEHFQRTYNIKFNKDGTVFDNIRRVCYNNLNEWANSVLKYV